VSAAFSRALTLAGLVLLAVLLLTPPGPAGVAAAAPLGVLVLAGLKPLRYWSIATAGVMLPYFAWGVMRLLTQPGARPVAVGFAALAIAVFLAALDSMRRR
jgi:uncharacterized membrane protein